MKLAPVIALACAACASAPHPVRYAVPAEVGRLVIDDAEFARFARTVRTELEASPPDKERRFVLAMLDALDDRWAEAVTELDRVRAMETDPHDKAMAGLTIRVWADARAHGGETPEAFGDALERAVATLPLELVRADLAMLRAMGHAFTPDVCRQLVDEAVKSDHGTVGLGDVHTIVFQRYAVKRLVQVGAVIERVLDAHGIPLPTG